MKLCSGLIKIFDFFPQRRDSLPWCSPMIDPSLCSRWAFFAFLSIFYFLYIIFMYLFYYLAIYLYFFLCIFFIIYLFLCIFFIIYLVIYIFMFFFTSLDNMIDRLKPKFNIDRLIGPSLWSKWSFFYCLFFKLFFLSSSNKVF